MNPQRLVAAFAAVAIGFGVTLVGVQLVDDDETVATVDAVDPDRVPTEENGADAEAQQDEAQQDEAAAEPPPDAEVVDGDTVEGDVDGDAAEAGDGEDDGEGDGDAPVATSSGQNPPREGTGDGRPGDGAEPGVVPECDTVLVVRTGTGELLILSSELGEFTESGGSFFLPGSDVSIGERFRAQDLELIAGVVDDRFERRSVEDCETGEVVEATIPFELDDDAGTEGPEERFPCSDDAFDALLDGLDGLEATELIGDAEVFVRVVAKRLARFGGASVGEWESDLEQVFDGFVPEDDCADEIDDIFVTGGGNDFFCAAANVSADQRLFVYLDELLPDQMARCTTIHGEGVN